MGIERRAECWRNSGRCNHRGLARIGQQDFLLEGRGGGDRDDLQRALIAIVSGRQTLEKAEIVWVAEEELIRDQISISSSKGKTLFRDMVRSHVDATNLDLVRLGKVARRVATATGLISICGILEVRLRSFSFLQSKRVSSRLMRLKTICERPFSKRWESRRGRSDPRWRA